MPRSRRAWAALSGLAVAVAALSAQAQTTGGLSGQVLDASTQAPVAGAVVIAASPSLQGEQTAVTDDTGTFEISLLPAGQYRLTVQHERYRPLTQDGLTVRLDRTVKVALLLVPEVVLGETVEITVARPVIATTSVQSGATITRAQMELIPYGRTTRNFEQVLTSVPGTQPDRFGVSMNGAGSPEASYIVDGISVNDPTYGHQGSTLLQDFVQEIDVKTGGYQAEYGRATGGVVNVVTKSGGNDFHGSVFVNWSPFEAARRQVGGQTVALSSQSHQKYNLDFGAELGGPILRDRLWFYLGFAPQMVSTGYDRIISARADDGTGKPQLNPDRTTRYTEIARKTYDSTQTSYQYTGKLTWLLDESHSLALAAYGNPTTIKGTSVGAGNEGAYLADGSTDSTDVSLRYQGKLLGKTMLVEAGLSWHHQSGSPSYARTLTVGPVQGVSAAQRMDTPSVFWSSMGFAAGTYFSLLDPRFDDGTIPDYQRSQAVLGACALTPSGFNPCPISGYYTGGPGYTFSDRSLSRYGLLLKLSNFAEALGHHQFKYGVDAQVDLYAKHEWQAGDVSFTAFPAYDEYLGGGYGTASPGQPGQPLLDGSGRPFALQYSQVDHTVQNRSLAAFAQDTWAILDKVVLEAGVRWERQVILGDPDKTLDGLGQRYQPATITLDNFMPRLGLIWDWTGRGLAKAYASAGRFYEYVPLDMEDRSITSAPTVTYGLQLSNCKDPRDPRTCRLYTEGDPLGQTRNGYAFFGTATGVDPKLQGQYTDEYQAGVQYQVWTDVALGVDYVHKQVGRVIEDMSSDEGNTYFISNPGEAGKLGYSAITPTGAVLFPPPRRVYDGLTLSAHKQFSNGWFASASWTYSSYQGNYSGLLIQTTGQLDPNITAEYDLATLLTNRDGPLPGDVPNSIKADAGFVHELDALTTVQLGGSLRVDQGGPTNYLGSRLYYGGEAYVLPRGSGPRLPWTWQLNLRAQVARRIGKDYTLGLSVDLINVTDNREVTGIDQNYTFDYVNPIVNGSQRDLAYLRTTAGAPVTPNANFQQPTSYQLPFTARVGAKLSF